MSHKSYSRMSRVNQLMLEVIADTLEKIDDPELEMVTVTGCEVTPDLRHARVYISSLKNKHEKEQILEILKSYKGEIKREISRSVRIKFLPDLEFMYDPSIDEGWKIEEIIKEIHDKENGLKVRADSLEDI